MNQDYTQFTLTTDRLILQAISSEYREDIFREFTPEITYFLHFAPTEDISGTDEFIASSLEKMADGEVVTCVILDKELGEFLGCVSMRDLHTRTPDFGLWVKTSAQGNGYGKEAVHALKSWAEKHLDYEYVVYKVAKENTRSIAIVESLGGVVAGEYSEMNQSGFTHPSFEYRIYKK